MDLGYCPTNQAGYHLVGGQCYFFSGENHDFDAQQALCATKFQGGRLFEPRSETARLGPSENSLVD